jgi:hypothetical protein
MIPACPNLKVASNGIEDFAVRFGQAGIMVEILFTSAIRAMGGALPKMVVGAAVELGKTKMTTQR